MKSIENLSAVFDCLASQQPLPEYLHTWLADALGRWRRGEPLPEAVGVFDSAGERRWRRNQELKDYSATLEGGTWQKAKTIADEIRAIRQGRRNVSHILKNIDAIYELPDTERQIYTILKS
jgi:hypothetical protein